MNPYIDERFREKRSKPRAGGFGAESLTDAYNSVKLITPQGAVDSFKVATEDEKETDEILDRTPQQDAIQRAKKPPIKTGSSIKMFN